MDFSSTLYPGGISKDLSDPSSITQITPFCTKTANLPQKERKVGEFLILHPDFIQISGFSEES
ncbi:hypothetical protein [Brotaphodocola sp.]|uniref:hypothetical protein n=1 Tax=Brotaphodocola sp. TaxID=3073577 RepID=UPI003D7C84F9